MGITRFWRTFLFIFGIGVLAVILLRLSLGTQHLFHRPTPTPVPASPAEVWPEQQAWQEIAFRAYSFEQAQSVAGPADSCHTYAGKLVCQYWPGRKQNFFVVVTVVQDQVWLVNVVARPGQELGSPSDLLAGRERRVTVSYLDYWGRRDTLYLFAEEGFAVEVEEGAITAVQYFPPTDEATYRSTWGRWHPRQVPADSQVDILLGLLKSRGFQLGQSRVAVDQCLNRAFASSTSGSCSQVRYSLIGDDDEWAAHLQVDYSGDTGVGLSYAERDTQVSMADIVREFGLPELVLGERNLDLVKESGHPIWRFEPLTLVYLQAGVQFTLGPASGFAGPRREGNLDEISAALAGAELWGVALISHHSPEAYLGDPCIAELRAGVSSPVLAWALIDPFPAMAAPLPTPMPAPTPLPWTGPLLYDQVRYKSDPNTLPLYDMGAGIASSIPMPWPVHRVYDWSPDGCYLPYLAQAEGRGQVHLLNISTLADRLLVTDTFDLDWAWTHLAWSSDGKWLATAARGDPVEGPFSSTLHILQVDGNVRWQVALPGQDATVLGWLPDSHALLYRSRHNGEGMPAVRQELYDLELLDVDTRLPVHLAHYQQPLESWTNLVITDAYTLRPVPLQLAGVVPGANFVNLFWTPDLRTLVVMTARSLVYQYEGVNLYRVELPGGQAWKLNEAEFCAENIALAPDGAHLAFEGRCMDEQDHLQAYLLDLATGETQLLVSPENQPLYNPGWSPDGRMLALVQKNMAAWEIGEHYIYDLATGEMTPLHTNGFDWYDALNWSPQMTYGPGACTGKEQFP